MGKYSQQGQGYRALYTCNKTTREFYVQMWGHQKRKWALLLCPYGFGCAKEYAVNNEDDKQPDILFDINPLPQKMAVGKKKLHRQSIPEM